MSAINWPNAASPGQVGVGLGLPTTRPYSTRPTAGRAPSGSDEKDPIIFRVQDNSRPLIVTCQWEWNREQFKSFQTFFRETLVYGSKSFNMDIFTEDSNGLVPHVCRFRGGYRVNPSFETRVTATIEAERVAPLPEPS